MGLQHIVSGILDLRKTFTKMYPGLDLRQCSLLDSGKGGASLPEEVLEKMGNLFVEADAKGAFTNAGLYKDGMDSLAGCYGWEAAENVLAYLHHRRLLDPYDVNVDADPLQRLADALEKCPTDILHRGEVWSLPMSKTEMRVRLNNMTIRKFNSFTREHEIRPVAKHRQLFQIRLDGMDAEMRTKLTKP